MYLVDIWCSLLCYSLHSDDLSYEQRYNNNNNNNNSNNNNNNINNNNKLYLSVNEYLADKANWGHCNTEIQDNTSIELKTNK